MNKIEFINVRKSYGHRDVIKGVSFSIKEKEIVSIIGPSGSGKSTLLNMLGMLEVIDGGKILIDGQRLPKINSKRATQFRRNKINYLFQSFALISNETVEKNLLIAMNYVKSSKKEKERRIDEVLKKLGIFGLKKMECNTLSGGEQQRVALARCILKPGDIVLADEPTGSLDPKMSDTVFVMLKDLRNSFGKTILIVTHDMNLAAQTDRQLKLKTQIPYV